MKPAAEHFHDAEADERIPVGMPVYQGSPESAQPPTCFFALSAAADALLPARAVKAGFIRKVYGILATQLLFTACSASQSLCQW